MPSPDLKSVSDTIPFLVVNGSPDKTSVAIWYPRQRHLGPPLNIAFCYSQGALNALFYISEQKLKAEPKGLKLKQSSHPPQNLGVLSNKVARWQSSMEFCKKKFDM